ncbi:alpha/beta hydrolase [Streptomyces sp. 8L]|uniref:alpha/beta hydrolase n=1 Tax=Streptomyces sp. 8L TaxID=2877242 RepID=UPI001CD4A2B3|nr:alpha/beta fold hydrolase [Streptomyces sp. 8L]MCA1223169.1 alpha/beta fold hydrolase [Streptomyces sp. 8L]
MVTSVKLRLACLFSAAIAAVASAVVPASAEPGPLPPGAGAVCRDVTFPVELTDGSAQKISGQYCAPRSRAVDTVQVLVHGATYNHTYWDFPYEGSTYSYVDRANRLGYATLAIDELGDGASSRPASTALTFPAIADSIHQVISQVHAGALGRHYASVMAVGHSFGSAELIEEIAEHGDVDAAVLTGSGHATSSIVAGLQSTVFYSANHLSRFASLDDGYVTSSPGQRAAILYYPPLADPRVVAADAATEDVVSQTELTTRPADLGALMKKITVPVLLVDGDKDNHYCTPDVDGTAGTALGCTSTTEFYQHEAANFSGACFGAMLVRSGHDITLHVTAPQSYTDILAWEHATLPARGHAARCAAEGPLPTPGIPLR